MTGGPGSGGSADGGRLTGGASGTTGSYSTSSGSSSAEGLCLHLGLAGAQVFAAPAVLTSLIAHAKSLQAFLKHIKGIQKATQSSKTSSSSSSQSAKPKPKGGGGGVKALRVLLQDVSLVISRETHMFTVAVPDPKKIHFGDKMGERIFHTTPDGSPRLARVHLAKWQGREYPGLLCEVLLGVAKAEGVMDMGRKSATWDVRGLSVVYRENSLTPNPKPLGIEGIPGGPAAAAASVGDGEGSGGRVVASVTLVGARKLRVFVRTAKKQDDSKPPSEGSNASTSGISTDASDRIRDAPSDGGVSVSVVKAVVEGEGVSARWEPDAHLFLFTLMDEMKALQRLVKGQAGAQGAAAAAAAEVSTAKVVHSLVHSSSGAGDATGGRDVSTSSRIHGAPATHASGVRTDSDASPSATASAGGLGGEASAPAPPAAGSNTGSAPLPPNTTVKPKKKTTATVALDLRSVDVSAWVGDGAEIRLQADTVFSAGDASEGVLLEGVTAAVNGATVLTARAMEVARELAKKPVLSVPLEEYQGKEERGEGGRGEERGAGGGRAGGGSGGDDGRKEQQQQQQGTGKKEKKVWDFVCRCEGGRVILPHKFRLRSFQDAAEDMWRVLKIARAAQKTAGTARQTPGQEAGDAAAVGSSSLSGTNVSSSSTVKNSSDSSSSDGGGKQSGIRACSQARGRGSV